MVRQRDDRRSVAVDGRLFTIKPVLRVNNHVCSTGYLLTWWVPDRAT